MPDNFLLAVSDLWAARYVSTAFIALLFWDHAITLEDEIALIWPAKFGVVKAIFLFNRYGVPLWLAIGFNMMSGFSTFLNDLTCRSWLTTNLYIQCIAIQSTAFIVATRVFDIWQSQYLAFLVLGALWTIHSALDLFICTDNIIRHYRSIIYDPISNVCFWSASDTWSIWLSGIVYHALIHLLLVWLWLSTPRTNQTPLMKLVVRDGFLYFVAIFSDLLFTLLDWRYARPSLAGITYISVWCITTICTSRMLLSMGSVQGPTEWGQRARIAIPSRTVDVELGTRIRNRERRVECMQSSTQGGTSGTGVSYSSFGSVVSR